MNILIYLLNVVLKWEYLVAEVHIFQLKSSKLNFSFN